MSAPPVPASIPSAAWDIICERERQVAVEGWSSKHDDDHDGGQLAGAAACYALGSIDHWAAADAIKRFWPWDAAWWKPKGRRANLIRAGALILAEIERLDRASAIEAASAGETRSGSTEGESAVGASRDAQPHPGDSN